MLNGHVDDGDRDSADANASIDCACDDAHGVRPADRLMSVRAGGARRENEDAHVPGSREHGGVHVVR